MRKTAFPLALLAASLLPAAFPASGEQDDRFADLVHEIALICRESPGDAWPLITEAESLIGGKDDGAQRVRLLAAMAPALAMRKGYASARYRLNKALQLAVDSSEPRLLVLMIRIAHADLALRHGVLRYGYRQVIMGLECIGSDTPSALIRELADRAIQLDLALGYPGHAHRIWEVLEETGALSDPHWRRRALLLKAWIATIDRNPGHLGECLDAFSREVDETLTPRMLENYRILKGMQALLEGQAGEAQTFLERIPAANAEYSFNGHLYFIKALMEWNRAADAAGVGELLEKSSQAYRQAGRPAFFPLALAMLMRWDKLGDPLAHGGPFLEAMAAYAFDKETSVISAYGFLARSQLQAESGDPRRALYSMRRFARMELHISSVMDELHPSWDRYQGSLSRKMAKSGGQAIELELYYLLILLLVFLIVILGLILRMQTQRHVNEQLQQAVRTSRDAQEATARANRLKSQFLSNISHEIKTPMSGLVGMVSILDELVVDPRYRKYIETIRVCSRNLLVLIDDLLDLGRMESGRLEIEKAPFHLMETLAYCQQMVMREAEKKKLDFRMQYDPGLPDVLIGDSVRLAQILVNLLTNAIKFTEEGSVVADFKFVPTLGQAGILTIRITDTGIGIPSERLGMVFEPFNQFQPEENRRVGGSGLGLAISRKLVDLLGGVINVDSKVGKGTTFTVELPFRKGPHKPEEMDS